MHVCAMHRKLHVSCTIDSATVGACVQRQACQFIDVREPTEHDLAHLNHFDLWPLSQVQTWLPRVNSLLDLDKPTYVLCHHGIRSMHVCNMLAQNGVQELYNVRGGIAEYSDSVDSSVPQY